ncbi:hypothetical protein FRC11_009279 [Ceratobasidium sp. 423]|nr:hypothetical protein FRC11_009279 [Ceratobasidium sp. 423]
MLYFTVANNNAAGVGKEREEREDKRDQYERRKEVKRQHTAAASPSRLPQTSKSRSMMSVEPPSLQASCTSNPPKNNAKGKGKAAPVVTKGGRVLSPINEMESFPIYPGPRPESDDPTELDVLIEEWKRQRLIWYLAYRNRKTIDPTTDYDDLKRVLGSDQGWDPENEELDGQVSRPSGPRTTTSVSHGGTRIGQFDEEPPARKPVKVQALPPPPPPPAKSQSNAASKGGPQTMTGIAKRPVSTEPEHSAKRARTNPTSKSKAPSNPGTQVQIHIIGMQLLRGSSSLQPKLGATSKSASQPRPSHGTSQENRPAQAQAGSNRCPPQAPAPTIGQSSSQAAANPKRPPQAPAPGGQNFPQAYTSGNLDHECHSALAPPPASGRSMTASIPTTTRMSGMRTVGETTEHTAMATATAVRTIMATMTMETMDWHQDGMEQSNPAGRLGYSDEQQEEGEQQYTRVYQHQTLSSDYGDDYPQEVDPRTVPSEMEEEYGE